MPNGWDRYPNLRTFRPYAPNKGRGRLQVQIRRAFMVGGPVLSTSAIFDWAYARRRRLQGNRIWSVHRILRERCERVWPRQDEGAVVAMAAAFIVAMAAAFKECHP